MLADIKATLGTDATDATAEEILHELIEGHDLTIDAKEKVTYASTA